MNFRLTSWGTWNRFTELEIGEDTIIECSFGFSTEVEFLLINRPKLVWAEEGAEREGRVEETNLVVIL